MKRSVFVAVLFGCAALVQAAVTPFSYYTHPDGRPLLIPEVREYKAGTGSVKFPAAVTVSVPQGEELIVEQIADEFKRFPEFKVRGYTFVLRSTPEREFDAVLRTIEMLAAFKLNAVFLSLEDAFPFKKNPKS